MARISHVYQPSYQIRQADFGSLIVVETNNCILSLPPGTTIGADIGVEILVLAGITGTTLGAQGYPIFGIPTTGDVASLGAGTSVSLNGDAAGWFASPGAGSITVTDGVTTVDPATTLNFTSGATVTNAVSGGRQPFADGAIRRAMSG